MRISPKVCTLVLFIWDWNPFLFLSGADERKHILAGGLELMLNTPTSRACKSSNFCRDVWEVVHYFSHVVHP